MFIELVEFLRCPENHPETHCVLSTTAMDGRYVVSGVVGCPACQREYGIDTGVVRFGSPPSVASDRVMPDAEAVQALLGISSPGGNVVLAGSAAGLARELVDRLEGVHIVGVNAPVGQRDGAGVSLLDCGSGIPLRSAMARGVVLGAEYAVDPWSEEAARILLPGLRLVVLQEHFHAAEVERVVVGQGMWLGQKERSGRAG